jgi:hypothetical protein
VSGVGYNPAMDHPFEAFAPDLSPERQALMSEEARKLIAADGELLHVAADGTAWICSPTAYLSARCAPPSGSSYRRSWQAVIGPDEMGCDSFTISLGSRQDDVVRECEDELIA